MLETIFLLFLEVSITTSIVILVLRLLSSYLNNTYAIKWKYWVWLLLALRLIVPVNLSTFTTVPVNITIPNNLINASNTSVLPLSSSIANAPEQEQILTTPILNKITYLDMFSALWLIGIAVFMIHQVSGYFTFKRKILRWSRTPKNKDIQNNIDSLSSQLGLSKKVTPLISDKVCNPMMIGFFRPLLILPNEIYSETDLNFILHHELIHCKRNDLWYKLLLVLANALHWFNPFVYLMFREASDDLELTCDDRVIRGSSFANRKAYAETLLASIHSQTMKKTALSTYFQGRNNIMKTRFINILNTKHRKNGAAAFLFIAIFIGLLGGFVACSLNDKDLIEDEKLYSGYISLDNDTLALDEFEFITFEDKERMEELNLTDEDMPNGYYIYNESDDLTYFDITSETEFTFFDLGNLFVKEEDDKKYTTTDKEEFRQFLYGSDDVPRITPFWINVRGKTVLSVTEQFVP
jgi:bla regulator protein blaR1